MKTIEEIINGESLTIEGKIAELKKTSVKVRDWNDIELEYNPKKHPVMTDTRYKDEVQDDGVEKMTRIPIGLQKLAARRMAQLMFGIPVRRVYKPTSTKQKEIAAVIEAIYQRNRIDSVNMERARYLFAGCQAATLWYATESKNTKYGIQSEIKIRCKNYSPMNGDTLYALFDEYEDLVALSFEYQKKEGGENVRLFDTYTKDRHISWVQGSEGWDVKTDEDVKIGKIPGVYIHREEPIWEDANNEVYEIEWTLSRNGNYIRRNAKPVFAIFANEGVAVGGEKKDGNKARSVFQLPENAKAGYITWESANESIKLQIENLYRSFFTQIQIPDMSFDQMKSTPMSGEARKMMFIDAQLKVTEESGPWLELLDREVNVIREFVKAMMPGSETEVDALKIETVITPFKISDEAETIKNLMTATGGKQIISQKEGIEQLGWSEDADATIRQINEENKSELFNPTE